MNIERQEAFKNFKEQTVIGFCLKQFEVKNTEGIFEMYQTKNGLMIVHITATGFEVYKQSPYNGIKETVNWINAVEKGQAFYSRDEILKICDNMRRFGGSFVKNLAEAIHKADADNLKILINGFDNLFQKYLNW